VCVCVCVCVCVIMYVCVCVLCMFVGMWPTKGYTVCVVVAPVQKQSVV